MKGGGADVEKRELAFNLYKDSNGEKPLVEIAQEVGASPGTVRGWKSRYKWDELIGKDTATPKRNVTKEKRSATRSVAESETPKMVIDNDDLTEKQKLFCLMYFEHRFNATKAYLSVFDCKYNTAMVEGSRLLRNPNVKKELNRIKAELQRDSYVTIKDIIAEYAKQAFAEITDFTEFGTEKEVYELEKPLITDEVDENGIPIVKTTGEVKYSYVHLKSSDEVDGSLIQEVKKGKDGVSVKLYDKQKALDMLFRYLGGDELRNAQIKAQIAKTVDHDDGEIIEDDGFIEALESEGAELWPDE